MADLIGKDILDGEQFTHEEIELVMSVADDFRHRLQEKPALDIMQGYVLATLFFEPSTRTRLSFESAMHRLSGSVIGFSSAESSSTAKGETLGDTIRTVDQYADIIAIRHPEIGSAKEAALAAKAPVLNGGEWSIANSINNLGLVAAYQNDYPSAYKLHQESLAIYRALDEKSGVAIATGNLGHVAMHLGRLEEARQWQIESVQLFNEIGDADGLAECFERLAMLANAKGDFNRAAQLFGVASVLRAEAGTLPALADQLEYERELELTRAQLDPATFEAAWAAGRGMALEQAIANINMPL